MDTRERLARELYRWGWQEMAILDDWEKASPEHIADCYAEADAILRVVAEDREKLVAALHRYG